MTELIIDDEIAERLRLIAEQERRSLDAILRAMLDSYPTSAQSSDWPRLMGEMADADTDIAWNEYASDLSERSRELLEDGLGDDPLKRLHNNADDST